MLDRVLALADAGDAPVTAYRDASTGEVHEERLSRGHVAAVVRMYAYSPMTAALLPLTLAEAAAGRPEPLLAQARMLVSSLDQQIHHGMQLSVMCTEDADEMQAREEDADTVLGNELISMSLAQCAVWPRGERPADFREPLRGDLPVLVLSGELDPVTPPRYGDEIVAHLPRGRHLVLPGQGHTTIGIGCMPKLTARFIDTLDAAELDATCLEGLRAMPPFSGFYGWEP
ncbi:alpha/beta hydrolase [Alkalisalibacterium limincola]|uniref:Alpha/beta hydrolase n=1 Tax=Alkalisalibacterium limincola TaxID=2699169 RepID=A0A5C8KJC1_9GAMM|nr:alpha/beta hydrolase [Alkalisalibacterium limincola]TXK60687.1 alpha/beta hydrolase [Alkalisalibacterium limincola]